MKKVTSRKKTHVVKKEKKKKNELIIKLADGASMDYFKLPRELKDKLRAEIPQINEMLKEFKQ